MKCIEMHARTVEHPLVLILLAFLLFNLFFISSPSIPLSPSLSLSLSLARLTTVSQPPLLLMYGKPLMMTELPIHR